MAKLADIKAWLNNPSSGSSVYHRNWDQQCQALMWQVTNKFGSAPTTYSSANTAFAASTIVSKDPNTAPPGAFHYWAIGSFGHVALAIGNGYALMGSSHVTDKWATNVGVASVTGYTKATGATYRGWSNTNGRNDLNVDDAYGASAPSVSASQRQVIATLPVKRRSAPNSQSAEAGAALEPGTVGNFDGWIHGESVNGNDVWFRGISGNWFWSGGFTDAGVHDLTDLNPVVAQPTTSRQVLPSAPTNARKDPSTANPATASVPANTAIIMTGWATGQAVSNNATWFTDGTSWYWSGGFTSQAVTGLTDLTSTVNPPAPVGPPYTVASLGIDVATGQAGIDFAAVKAAGVGFVIVKMGGLNVTPQYIAPHYAEQVDAAREAGMKIGHYYLIGAGQTPTQQADYFVANLHNFDVNSDVLALDNEPLDSNKATWADAQVAEFFTEVMAKTGIPATRLWHYSSASQFRTLKPWSATEALGVKVWWASFGGYPTTFVPDHSPDLQGSVGDWTAHQFSSKVTVAGKIVDASASRSTLDALFAKGNVVDITPPVVVEPDPPVVTDPAADNSQEIEGLKQIIAWQTSALKSFQDTVETLQKLVNKLQ